VGETRDIYKIFLVNPQRKNHEVDIKIVLGQCAKEDLDSTGSGQEK
jgi:hypothetical protein